jgi:hypothetical protein
MLRVEEVARLLDAAPCVSDTAPATNNATHDCAALAPDPPRSLSSPAKGVEDAGQDHSTFSQFARRRCDVVEREQKSIKMSDG